MGAGPSGEMGERTGMVEPVFLACDCCSGVVSRRMKKVTESAVTPRIMRLNRAELRISMKDEEDGDPNRNINVDDPYITVNQMFEKEDARYSFAHRYVSNVRREKGTTFC